MHIFIYMYNLIKIGHNNYAFLQSMLVDLYMHSRFTDLPIIMTASGKTNHLVSFFQK